jgi:hypothetical protein
MFEEETLFGCCKKNSETEEREMKKIWGILGAPVLATQKV